MDTKLFLHVVNNRVLKKKIFDEISFIHKKLKIKSYKWSQVIMNPTLLGEYNYQELFKKSFKKKIPYNMGEIYSILIKNNNIDLFTFIIKEKLFENIFYTYSLAIKYDHFEMLKSIHSLSPVKDVFDYLLSNTCSNNFEIIKWLSDRFDEEGYQSKPTTIRKKNKKNKQNNNNNDDNNDNNDTTSINNNNNNRESYYKPEYRDFVYRKAMSHASKLGRLDMVKWLYDKSRVVFGKFEVDLVKCTIGGGNTEILDWLFSKSIQVDISYGYSTMLEAVRNGHFDMLKYLHHHNMGDLSEQAMNYAAEIGRLDMLQWLHENRTEGCTFEAMNLAAKNNHFEVVQWLHLNRTEGCTSMAMAYASLHSLELVQWFHTNRTEGCHSSAISIAATHSLEIVKFLNENYEYLEPSTNVIENAAKNNRIDIIRYLYQHRIIEFDLPNTQYSILNYIKLAIKQSNNEMLALYLDIPSSTWQRKMKTDINIYIRHANENRNQEALDILNNYKNRIINENNNKSNNDSEDSLSHSSSSSGDDYINIQPTTYKSKRSIFKYLSKIYK